MTSRVNVLRLPASESYKNIVLLCCVVIMSLLSVALAWQAQVISSQHEAIQWLVKARFGN
jgi:hypothetical protein